MGPIGVQEMIIIFFVALVLFGPKKLPELGKTIGKALTEFRRASNDLKATFEREMHNIMVMDFVRRDLVTEFKPDPMQEINFFWRQVRRMRPKIESLILSVWKMELQGQLRFRIGQPLPGKACDTRVFND